MAALQKHIWMIGRNVPVVAQERNRMIKKKRSELIRGCRDLNLNKKISYRAEICKSLRFIQKSFMCEKAGESKVDP